jgi:hypothetical protein
MLEAGCTDEPVLVIVSGHNGAAQGEGLIIFSQRETNFIQYTFAAPLYLITMHSVRRILC